MSKYDETPEENLARHVESDRIIIAAEIAAEKDQAAEDVEVTRAELARILEADRKRHNARTEERLHERTRVINRRFWFLFGALFVITGALAYHDQVTSNSMQDQLDRQCAAIQQLQTPLTLPALDCRQPEW